MTQPTIETSATPTPDQMAYATPSGIVRRVSERK